ncbi:UDP-glycosyltransferase UGT5-like [Calliphora vicina]|uniref:UDP-glycosyltransferase UGT5-like n=1 Tax=Calliphora vicina TaxID=7373 RepID=UPI00325C09FC
MKFKINLFTVLIIFLNCIEFNESAKILAVFPFPGRSQYILVQPFLKTLAQRGHELTVINAYPGKENVTNYRDVAVMEVHSIDFVAAAEEQERNLWGDMTFLSDFFTNVTLAVMKNPQVQNLLKTETFDLIILESVNTDAWYSLGAHFNAPIIGVSSYGTDPIIDELMGNISPFTYVPLMSTGFTEKMSYTNRMQNLLLKLLELIHNRLVHLPRHQRILDKYMPHIKQDIWSLRQNMSLFLMNQHFSLSSPRSYVTNMIEIGGFQIQHQPKPLPQKIQDFLDNSTQDVIYFSMGSNIKSKDFPVETLQIFNKVFAQLPYKILWKFENPKLEGKPSNVLISSWFPQGDILAHPKVKLFISHGGLLSTFESVYHGKPILGLPAYFDQQMNVNRAKQQGFALALDFRAFNTEQLKTTILEMLNNPQYIQRAKEISLRYHDQPIKPIDLAVYWTEYVLRHNGALHLQSQAQKMGYFKKHGVDCLAGLIIFVISVLVLIIWLFVKICKVVFVKTSKKVKIN